ncbi:MAG: hypothetical protein GF390_03020 [Candidatus Pacebacteria bacterium]|nr:hypothetical protein [Candidatus Paceibacterota bacterium]
MRKLYWYLTAYFKKHGWVVAATLVLAIIIFSLSLPIVFKKIEPKPHHYVGLVGEYTLFDLPSEIKNKLSVGLTTINPEDKSVTPLLAERWIAEDEGKTYRFILKEDLKWQDGTPLTPADIHYNFKDVEIIHNPNDVIFKLPDVFAPFPSVVSEPLFKTVQERYFFIRTRPTLIGLGEYQVLNYHKTGNYLKQITIDSPAERITYRFYLTEKDAVLGFKKGEVDELPDLSQLYDFADWNHIDVKKHLHTDRYLAIFFNNADPLLNKSIRQALSYGLSKPDDETRVTSPIDKKSWAYLEATKGYEHDLSRAIERLLDALPPTPLEFTLTTTATFQPEAEQIKTEWEQLGEKATIACERSDEVENKQLCENLKIQVNIRVQNFPDTNDFQLLLMAQEIPPDPDQYFLWHSDQSTNFTHYKNTRIDSLLEKGRQVTSQAERKVIYQEFQQFLLEDPPAIFLKYLISYEIKR